MAYLDDYGMTDYDERPKDVRGIEGSDSDKPVGMNTPSDLTGNDRMRSLPPETSPKRDADNYHMPTDGVIHDDIPVMGKYKDSVLGSCPRGEYPKPPGSV